MRRILSVFVSLALCAAALPPSAYAQAAVRVAAPRSASPNVVVPALSFSPSSGILSVAAGPLATLAPASSLIRSLPSPADPLPAAAPTAVRAQAALQAVPSATSPIAQAARQEPAPERPADSQRLLSEVERPPVANDDAPEAPRVRGRETKGRIALRFAELRAAFGERKAEELAPTEPHSLSRPGSGLDRPAPTAAETANDIPAPEAKPSKGLFGLTPVLLFFLAALAIENVGLEAQNLGMPPLITKVFGDVSLSAEMGMWAAFADIVGSLVTPPIIARLGLKKTFLWSGGARLVFAGITAGLLATGTITIPWLMALTAVGALFGGMNYTAEKAIPAVLVRQDRAGLERFKAARQGVIEVIATAIPIVAGALVAQFGFMPAIWAFPVAGTLALALVAMTLRMPQRTVAVMAALPDGGAAPANLKDFWGSVSKGTRLLWGHAALRNSFLGYAAFGILSHLLYWIIAPAYGILVAGPGREEAAALVQGVMLGLFSLGGLIASVYMMREHKRFDRLEPGQREPAMRRSLRNWMLLGTVSLLAMVTMAVPLPAWGALTVPALALIPFGLAQVVAKLKLEALFQASAPPDAVSDVSAALEAWMSVAIMLGLWGMNVAFGAATGYTPFAVIAWAMLPLAAASLVLTHLLARTKKSA